MQIPTTIRYLLSHLKIAIPVAICVMGFIISAYSYAQTWDYQSVYSIDNPPGKAGARATPGYITLSESGEKPILHMFAGNVAKCFSGDLQVKIQRSTETITILVPPKLRGCGSIRFVIRNDGSGGQREVILAGKWVGDGIERGLTLRK